MHLMVFDLDAALCPTNTMDGLALSKALQDVTSQIVNPELLMNSADFRKLFVNTMQRFPTRDELFDFRAQYNVYLKQQFIIRPSFIPANYALIEQANALQHRKDTLVAIITSRTLSALKIKSAKLGLMSDLMPVASCEDADSYSGILSALTKRVRRSFGLQYDQASLVSVEANRECAANNDMSLILESDFNESLYGHLFEWSEQSLAIVD
ncbi:hypothetical protein KO489_02175 [Reinekea forsetii]|nr:hypothetical protein [Reinekea forsetii]